MFDDTDWSGLFEALVVICVIGAFGFCIFDVAKRAQVTRATNEYTVSQMNYSVVDVEIFLRGTDYSLSDFINSPSLRKQYDSFSQGNKSDFIEQARAHRQAQQAKSSADTATAMAGAAMVMSIANSR